MIWVVVMSLRRDDHCEVRCAGNAAFTKKPRGVILGASLVSGEVRSSHPSLASPSSAAIIALICASLYPLLRMRMRKRSAVSV